MSERYRVTFEHRCADSTIAFTVTADEPHGALTFASREVSDIFPSDLARYVFKSLEHVRRQ